MLLYLVQKTFTNLSSSFSVQTTQTSNTLSDANGWVCHKVVVCFHFTSDVRRRCLNIVWCYWRPSSHTYTAQLQTLFLSSLIYTHIDTPCFSRTHCAHSPSLFHLLKDTHMWSHQHTVILSLYHLLQTPLLAHGISLQGYACLWCRSEELLGWIANAICAQPLLQSDCTIASLLRCWDQNKHL